MEKFSYIFGPVPSRRLGMSLGVDLIPYKTCTLNCVYCESGPTTCLTDERKEYIPIDDIKKELTRFLAMNPFPDFITFSGAGEPTLNSGMTEIAAFIKKNWPKLKTALITNGTLLFKESVCTVFDYIDVILPSLDAATEEMFLKINRPYHNITLANHIKGLKQLRSRFSGQIWLEVFIIAGMNDSEHEIEELHKIIETLNVDRIQLNTLDRPGSVKSLKPASIELLNKIKVKFGHRAEIILSSSDSSHSKPLRTDLVSAITGLVERRPCTLKDLSASINLPESKIKPVVELLIKQKQLISESGKRGIFYRILS